MSEFFDALTEKQVAMIAAQPLFLDATAAADARINLSPEGHDSLGVLSLHFTLLPGTRRIYEIAIEGVQEGCGWGVPVMALEHERHTLVKHDQRADPDRRAGKHRRRRSRIDGLSDRPTDRHMAGDETGRPR